METLQDITMETVTGMMDSSYTLACVDYRESFDSNRDIIQKCLDDKNAEALNDLESCYSTDNEWCAANEIMEELKKKLTAHGYRKWQAEKFFEENEDGIREEINNRDDSDPMRNLLRNTKPVPVRIELISNYDCINSHWLESSGGFSYEESYFGDIIDALNLNPSKVGKLLKQHGETVVGRYPNKRSRDGKEYAAYEDFYEELLNTTCGANLLTFVGTIDIRELYEANFKIKKITIPKDNCCGLFSSMQGGGGMMNMKLTQDLRIDLTRKDYPYYRIQVEMDDTGYGYSIQQTYGVIDTFYGAKLGFVIDNEASKSHSV